MKQPEVIKNAYYEVREAAAVLGVSDTTLYRWTASIPLHTATRKSNGRRVWSGSELIKAYNAQY